MTSSPREPMNRIGCSPVDQSSGCTYDQIMQIKDLPQKVCSIRLSFKRKWFQNIPQRSSRQILVKFYVNHYSEFNKCNSCHVEENMFIANLLHSILRNCYSDITNYRYSKVNPLVPLTEYRYSKGHL